MDHDVDHASYVKAAGQCFCFVGIRSLWLAGFGCVGPPRVSRPIVRSLQ